MNARTLELADACPSDAPSTRLAAFGKALLRLMLALATRPLHRPAADDAATPFPIDALRSLSAELSDAANGCGGDVRGATRRYLDAASR